MSEPLNHTCTRTTSSDSPASFMDEILHRRGVEAQKLAEIRGRAKATHADLLDARDLIAAGFTLRRVCVSCGTGPDGPTDTGCRAACAPSRPDEQQVAAALPAAQKNPVT